MLAWHSLETLRNTLKALSSLPEDVFADRVIYFQEMTAADQQLAAEFGFRAEGNEKNQGIREGIKQAVSCCRADTVVFLECDCLLHEAPDVAIAQLQAAAQAIAAGELDVVRLRHTRAPGEDYIGSKKYQRYWPVDGQPVAVIKRLRRLLRPLKARRLIGQAVVACDRADKQFPGLIGLGDDGLYRLSSAIIPWTNQAIMVNRRWFLEVILPFAESNPTSRSVNGFPDLEKELNCSWWRRAGFRVGQARPGLFTHYRLDRPENDEKTLLHG